MSELSKLQETERAALLLDREAVLRVVSALRSYREASKKLLSERYLDGECDAFEMSRFAVRVESIEDEE